VDSAKQMLVDYPSLHVYGQVGTYDEALASLPPATLPHRMVFFLGSSLGNFSPEECDRFFDQVTTVLSPGDYFLLGIDLQKDTSVLEAAYNDAQGITAAFNLNMLTHLNRRFQGTFERDRFRHQAIYNKVDAQIEMYLHATTDHSVTLNALDTTVDFAKDEPLRTEISRKFDVSAMETYLSVRGLSSVQTWTDPKRWFAITLCRREP